ncbi:T-lymphocyte activation antigen CD80 isoform X2 [Electrophorus electricus]|uniref:T-lymphocyte activation antigen CD80 isoform X2 n=1 Tax=Electrophorus electricus TaxID=8005 RepID=UPI0015D0B8B9|nr:T-lymphocyte activation antigen CD80 isoform X2 [Electrophorus electricus]
MLRSYLFLLGVISAGLSLISGDVNPVVNLTGVVEGSVRLHCLFSKNETIVRIYFQKKVENEEQIFIIGYDSKKPLEVPEKYRNRCSMDKQAATMELSQLTLADEGVYFCIAFNSAYWTTQTTFHLTVTANYTVPEISSWRCSEPGFSGSLPSCTVTCSSSGGYPWSNVGWAVDGGNPGDVLRVAGNTSEQDPHSHLWNVSQNATLNCTRPVNVTCVVGGSISSPITLCTHLPSSVDWSVIIASVLLLLLIIVIAAICTARMCRRPQHQEQGVEIWPLNPPALRGQAG